MPVKYTSNKIDCSMQYLLVVHCARMHVASLLPYQLLDTTQLSARILFSVVTITPFITSHRKNIFTARLKVYGVHIVTMC